jgi:hypothetical protein
MSPTATKKLQKTTRPRGSVPYPASSSENPSLETGEKTLLYLLIDALDALLEAEDIIGELCNDTRGYLLLCG